MLVTPRYNGIEIPVFPADTEVIPDMKTAEVDQTQDKLIRASRVTDCISRVFNNITDYLEAADRELTHAAELCRAIVVPHSWGLFELDPNNPNPELDYFRDGTPESLKYVPPILPKNYILVSEVAVVKQASSSLNLHDRDSVVKGVLDYDSQKEQGDLVYVDNNEDQYASGVVPEVTGGKRDLFLIDVEPLIIKL